MKNEISNLIKAALSANGFADIPSDDFSLEYPDDPKHGDISTNVAMIYAKKSKANPRELADKVATGLRSTSFIEKIEIAGPGFINIFLKPAYFQEKILKAATGLHTKSAIKKKIMVEYTDPNPFKVFHIGHLMSNAIGESIARLKEYRGDALVLRACYQGDVGLHIAKVMWAIIQDKKNFQDLQNTATEKASYLGKLYAQGAKAYEEKPEIKAEIDRLNKIIFDKSDNEINQYYKIGRQWSLDYFEKIYKRLDTKFDYYFFESEVAQAGLDIVRKYTPSVFEESQGAVIFPGEKHSLHTRVFINALGVPTYEAKDLGLNQEKFIKEPDLAESIIITANEQNEYFKVVLKAMTFVLPEVAKRTVHIGHGMMKLPTGKMSSRTGDVVSAEEMIADASELAKAKMLERGMDKEQVEQVSDEVAIGAIKYMILRQAIGGDIVYDVHKAFSFDGDSGPYLQYAGVRASSILKKAKEQGLESLRSLGGGSDSEGVSDLEKHLIRFDEVVDRATEQLAPHYVTIYLTELAGLFNSYYTKRVVLDEASPNTPYRLTVVNMFYNIMKEGLALLAIKLPEKM